MSVTYHNKAPTIAELRRRGYKVFVKHEHEDVFDHTHPDSPGRRVGVRTTTSVAFESPIGQRAVGQAVCHPTDNWNRKLGVAMATGRAWKAHLATNINHRKHKPTPVETPTILDGNYPT